MQYDYSKALERLHDMRRKVISQKNGKSVDGLTVLPEKKQPLKKRSSKSNKNQEVN